MTACNYSFPLQGDPQTAFTAAKAQILKQGGTVNGSSIAGNARIPSPVGAVLFEYQVTGQTLAVGVIDKPFLVSCDKIHSELQKALAYAPQPVAAPSTTTQQTAAQRAQSVAATQAVPANPSHVIELDTQYIEGDPGAPPVELNWKLAAMLGGLVLFSGALWWLHTRRR